MQTLCVLVKATMAIECACVGSAGLRHAERAAHLALGRHQVPMVYASSACTSCSCAAFHSNRRMLLVNPASLHVHAAIAFTSYHTVICPMGCTHTLHAA